MRIGVDLGGTKIEAVALDETGAEVVRMRVATPRNDYGATVKTITSLIATLETRTHTSGKNTIGIGIPGTPSPKTGLIKNANSTWLIGKPLQRDIETILGQPVRLANDADCFTMSEAMDGAGRGAASVFGVILGTGVGGGFVFKGHLLSGPNAIAGEWGHNPMPWPEPGERPGPLCYCGLSGCVETYLSGPGLSQDFNRHTGLDATPQEITEMAHRGDGGALATLVRYHKRLARALASVINILDPEVIVLGGGLSNMPSLYRSVPEFWGEWVFSDDVVTKLAKNKHGDSSGVRGAAWLWNHE